MRKIVISIIVIIIVVFVYNIINKDDIDFSKDLLLPERMQNISFSEYPKPPVYNAPSIKNIDSEVLVSNAFLQKIGDSILCKPIIEPLKINKSKDDYLIVEKLEGISISKHNTLMLSLKCKFKINELFSRITMTATEVVVEAVPIVIMEENYPIKFNFSMTKLKVNDLAPAIEKGLAHLATKALNNIESSVDLEEFINLDIKRPQSNEIISPDFKIFTFNIEESGLSLLTSIDE